MSKQSLVFSAIQPTAMPHLGNYLGAIRPWTRLVSGRENSIQQNNNMNKNKKEKRAFDSVIEVESSANFTPDEGEGKEFMFAIADMHAWTSPKGFRSKGEEDPSFVTAAMLMACGLDPLSSTTATASPSVILFQQSQVPYHANLMWLLSCMVPLGGLEAMTHWREKTRSQRTAEKGSLGLLSYPVLQAADILLYRATHVPVGEDQKQHLELCRNLARRLNHRINSVGSIGVSDSDGVGIDGGSIGGRGEVVGEVDSSNNSNAHYFPVPDPMIAGLGGRIKCLRKVQEKMSKSTVSPEGTIFLSDPPADVERKISRAITDSLPGITFDRESRPGLANLLVIYASILDNDTATITNESDIPGLIERHGLGAMSKQQFKAKLTDLLVPRLSQIQERYQTLLGRDRNRVEQVLALGNRKANERAKQTWQFLLSTL